VCRGWGGVGEGGGGWARGREQAGENKPSKNLWIHIKIVCATLGSLVANGTWRPDFVHSWITIACMTFGILLTDFHKFCGVYIYIYIFFVSVFNQLDAQNVCFTISFISRLYMFRAHVLIIRRSKLHYTASGVITFIRVTQILSQITQCNALQRGCT
jgi:hypothetical protein